MLADAIDCEHVRDGLARLARLSGRDLHAWSEAGELLHSTGAAPNEPAGPRRYLALGGRAVGFLTASDSGPEGEDAVAMAAHVVGERLRAESEKNALAGEILAKMQELSVLHDVSGALAHASDFTEVTAEVLERVCGLLEPDWAALLSYDADTGQARVARATIDLPAVPAGWRSLDADSFTWRALNRDEPVLLPRLDPADRQKVARDLGGAAGGASSVLFVPMSSSRSPVGAIVLVNGPERRAFNSIDVKLVHAVASQAAISTGHLRLYEESKEMFFSTVWALASAIDAKDAYTHGHSQRVARYSSALGRELGFDDQEIERLELSAVLHDIGKIGVPEAVLNKEGRLTPAEMSIMRSHPEKGASILASIRAMRDIVPGVLHHHERWDGLGYPDGLKGENIPLNARIILVADTFDAMTSTRPYRDGLALRVAVEEIERCAGTQFDPKVAAAFVRLVERGVLRIDATALAPAQETASAVGARDGRPAGASPGGGPGGGPGGSPGGSR